MRLVRTVLAASLCAGLALTAGNARAGAPVNDRIDGDFIVDDDVNGANEAVVEIDGTTFSVSGSVFGVGTAGDDVEIQFFTPQPSNASANDKKGNVKQNKFSQITFLIESDVAARDLDLTVTPEKCAVNGNVNVNAGNGNVTAKCSGDNLYQAISADQLASIQAAFLDQQRVKIKVNGNDAAKGSVSIQIKGEASED
jgi:hypothetical protein